MDVLNLLLAPVRFVIRMVQDLLVLMGFAIILVVAPFISFLTMPGFEHKTNTELLAPDSYSRKYVRIDFSNNKMVGVSENDSKPYPAGLPETADYKSINADELGMVPSLWGFWNVVGFSNDRDMWTRGKEAPMYAAYSDAATSSDALRNALLQAPGHKLHKVILPDAPKIEMVFNGKQWAGMVEDIVLYGVCPVSHCEKEDLQFHEARDLFTPSVSKGQAEAIAQMRYTMTDEYWLREAHANGIFDKDSYVRMRATINREYLVRRYTPQTGPSHFTVYMEFSYLILVFGSLGFLILKMVQFSINYNGREESGNEV